MAKQTPTQRADAAEAKTRELRAKLEQQSIKAAIKAQNAMLAVYQAADQGRRNRDWRAQQVSADAAYIPDRLTIIARARQMARDSWAGRSAVRAFVRNVVRCGIVPMAQAKDADGKLLSDLNRRLTRDFWEWANDARACDVTREQTFWQMQALAEQERVVAGESFFYWSYEPKTKPDGSIDTAAPLGLKLQMFEADQLDTRLISYEGREVRGGIEVDDVGAPTAYHIYRRNINDYLPLPTLESLRIPAERVFRYRVKSRVRETHGVSDLVTVMQEIRDLSRYSQATLWRAIMESCIGVIIKQQTPSTSAFGTMPLASGDTGATSTGLKTVDFVPGMTAVLNPGEDVTAFTPQAPGNLYEPYVRQQLRSIAAGCGLGYGQLTMDFTQGTYSGQRQEMLETRSEFEPLQELLAHSVVLPVWRLFVQLSILEGRIAIEDFGTDPRRYTDADYVAPPQPWIDPEKEINAWQKAVEMRVMDRSEIAHMRGTRLVDIWDRVETEQKEAADRGIVLPETQDNGEVEFKREIIKSFIADGTVADVIANSTDLGALVEQTGLPRQPGYKEPWLPVIAQPGVMVTGDVVEDADGDIVGGDVEDSTVAADEMGGDPNEEPAKPDPEDAQSRPGTSGAGLGVFKNQSAPPKKNGVLVAPNYRPALTDAMRCATCDHFKNGKCAAFDFPATPAWLCDAWEADAVIAATPTGIPGRSGYGSGLPPVPDGQRPMDDPRSTFNDRPERGIQ